MGGGDLTPPSPVICKSHELYICSRLEAHRLHLLYQSLFPSVLISDSS